MYKIQKAETYSRKTRLSCKAKKMRIILIGSFIRKNLGGPLIVLGTAKLLRNIFPNAQIVYLSENNIDLSVRPKDYLLDNILIIPKKGTLKRIVFLLKNFAKADIVVDVWGILFSDTLTKGSLISRIFEGLHLMLAKMLGKFVIKGPVDIGPVYSRWTALFAKLYLSMPNILFARSKETEFYLRKLKVKLSAVTPDVGFMVGISTTIRSLLILPERLDDMKVIGISVSHTLRKFERYENQYAKIVLKIIEWLVEKWNSYIILIPNETYSLKINDLHVAKKNLRYDQSKLQTIHNSVEERV